MHRILTLFTIFFISLFSHTALAATVPCLKMQANPSVVGEALVATYDTCEAGDKPLQGLSTNDHVQLYARWYHPSDDGGIVGNDVIDAGKYKSGLVWSDVAAMCKGKCEGFTPSHVQTREGQVCVKLVNGKYTPYDYSPAAASCIVIGYQCIFDVQNASIIFPEGSVSDLNGQRQGTNVNLQCGGDTDVRYTLKSSQSTISEGNTITLYSGADGNITGKIFIDDKPFTAGGLVFNENGGSNLHEISVTLNIDGKPVGQHAGSFILVSEIQ